MAAEIPPPYVRRVTHQVDKKRNEPVALFFLKETFLLPLTSLPFPCVVNAALGFPDGCRIHAFSFRSCSHKNPRPLERKTVLREAAVLRRMADRG